MTVENGEKFPLQKSTPQFMEVASPFWDIRCQDLADSGPNGYGLAADAGTIEFVNSPFGLGKAMRFDGAESLKLANAAHDALFQAFAKLESSVIYIACAWRETGVAGSDKAPIVIVSGDVLSTTPSENVLFAVLCEIGNELKIGGQDGGGVSQYVYTGGLPQYAPIAFAVSKEPGPTPGKIIYKLHHHSGVAYESAEVSVPDGGGNGVLKIGTYTNLAYYWEGYLQQILMKEGKEPDAQIAARLAMIVP